MRLKHYSQRLVDNIQVGGRNLLSYGKISRHGGTVTITNLPDGEREFLMEVTSLDTPNNWGIKLNAPIYVNSVDQSYMTVSLKVYIYSWSGSRSEPQSYIRVVNTDDTENQYGISSGIDFRVLENQNKWILYSCTFKLLKPISQIKYFFFYGDNLPIDCVAAVKSIKLEFGNKATDWTHRTR